MPDGRDRRPAKPIQKLEEPFSDIQRELRSCRMLNEMLSREWSSELEKQVARSILHDPSFAEFLGFDTSRDYKDDYPFHRFLFARLAVIPPERQIDIIEALAERLTSADEAGLSAGTPDVMNWFKQLP